MEARRLLGEKQAGRQVDVERLHELRQEAKNVTD
jgi:CHAD domain-containing protein